VQTSKELTQSERGWLEHLRRAQEQGLTLVDYAQSAGVKVGSLYEARRRIARRGVQRPLGEIATRKVPEFITVQAEPSVRVSAEPVCRVRHPGGWDIECTSWPPAAWVAELFGGGAHDTP
jgi:hypothetical protein